MIICIITHSYDFFVWLYYLSYSMKYGHMHDVVKSLITSTAANFPIWTQEIWITISRMDKSMVNFWGAHFSQNAWILTVHIKVCHVHAGTQYEIIIKRIHWMNCKVIQMKSPINPLFKAIVVVVVTVEQRCYDGNNADNTPHIDIFRHTADQVPCRLIWVVVCRTKEGHICVTVFLYGPDGDDDGTYHNAGFNHSLFTFPYRLLNILKATSRGSATGGSFYTCVWLKVFKAEPLCSNSTSNWVYTVLNIWR